MDVSHRSIATPNYRLRNTLSARQLTEACGWECTPRYIARDRDRAYSEFFTRRLPCYRHS
jgi:hypothetical protein